MTLPWRVLALLLATTPSACNGSPPQAPAPPPAHPARRPEPALAALAPTPPPPPSASATQAPSAQPDAPVRAACSALCDRVRSTCPTGRADDCLAQCARYEERARGCEAEAEAAFTCQREAPENYCDGVASSRCADAFIRMQRCHRGEASPASPAPPKRDLPEGWERVSDPTWGLSWAMPKGAAVDPAAKSRTWKATGAGATFEVIELPRPAKKDSTDLIKLIIAHHGITCQRQMRLTGRVDLDAHMFARYETGCNGGERLHGKLRIDDRRALSMVVRGNVPSELRDVFLDSLP